MMWEGFNCPSLFFMSRNSSNIFNRHIREYGISLQKNKQISHSDFSIAVWISADILIGHLMRSSANISFLNAKHVKCILIPPGVFLYLQPLLVISYLNTICKYTISLNVIRCFFVFKPLPKNMVSRLCESKKVCAAADMQLQVCFLHSGFYSLFRTCKTYFSSYNFTKFFILIQMCYLSRCKLIKNNSFLY